MLATSSDPAVAGAAALGLGSTAVCATLAPSLDCGAGDDGADSACGLAAGAASALMVLHRRWGQQVQRVYAAGSASRRAPGNSSAVRTPITKAELSQS